MPVWCEIQDSVLIVRLIGKCGAEVTVAISEAMEDPAMKAGTSLLLDVHACSDSPTSHELRRRAISLAGRKGLSRRCAIVIGKSTFEYGLARMAATHVQIQGMEMEIFTDFEAALHWLHRASEASTQEQTEVVQASHGN